MSEAASFFANKTILAIGAHPDDIEFGCGGTMVLLAQAGAKVHFAVATDGSRGSRQHEVAKLDLITTRSNEAQAAATILGAQQVSFLNQEDGNLQANLAFKEQMVRLIREVRPDAIFTHDPTWLYQVRDGQSSWVNHTDHRSLGTVVLDAVYPLARDLQSFPEHAAEGLMPHTVPQLYLFGESMEKINCRFDIGDSFDTKIAALAAHASQFDDMPDVEAFARQWHRDIGQAYGMDCAEGFVCLNFTDQI